MKAQRGGEGGPCTYGEDQKWIQHFERELETEDTVTNQGIEGRIILIWILMWQDWRFIELIYLVQGGDQVKAFVKSVMNICFRKMQEHLENLGKY